MEQEKLHELIYASISISDCVQMKVNYMEQEKLHELIYASITISDCVQMNVNYMDHVGQAV
jgi:hypothetical protein